MNDVRDFGYRMFWLSTIFSVPLKSNQVGGYLYLDFLFPNRVHISVLLFAIIYVFNKLYKNKVIFLLKLHLTSFEYSHDISNIKYKSRTEYHNLFSANL